MFVQGGARVHEDIDVSAVDAEGPWFAIRVGTGGDVKVDTPSLTGYVLKNAPDGAYEVGEFTKIYSSGTTASDILGYVS